MKTVLTIIAIIIALVSIIVSIIVMIRAYKSSNDLLDALDNLNRARDEFMKHHPPAPAQDQDIQELLDESDEALSALTGSTLKLADVVGELIQFDTVGDKEGNIDDETKRNTI